ncbi:ribokinase [Dyadobacter fanqingshengii]|uniref:Ribokinase n=1 Tax=Dyadobacter fanqingshengii TaxID=2906443 RepID=A0A9X1PDC6_9BACT|nr:ribokinase [Dyadobacter fanqingshengii]MCF0041633.1 ribokinase [Dyadobacter fanqingshengii]USJ36650.1 ribokinase [Dyadobacter fanqingshengii]
MKKKVLVIGSSNTDMVVQTADFPKPGETVLGGEFLMNAGGKGANQAVAAARLGANVRFVAKIGKDLFGQEAKKGFLKEGLDIQYLIETADHASGIALITVNANGENEIVVASGANMNLHPSDLPDEIFQNIDFALIQLEIPLKTITYIIDKCRSMGIKVIMNPAPAASLDKQLLASIHLITPNETETELLTGIYPGNAETMQKASGYFHQAGIAHVIITLGSAGVYLSNKKYAEIIPAHKVKALDTTAAGDVFNGAILTALASGEDWPEACRFACKAAAISVTRIGAQNSAPYLHELTSL